MKLEKAIAKAQEIKETHIDNGAGRGYKVRFLVGLLKKIKTAGYPEKTIENLYGLTLTGWRMPNKRTLRDQ